MVRYTSTCKSSKPRLQILQTRTERRALFRRLPRGSRKEIPKDFALWKQKKAGEPFWPSPWGEGRPGWHIECCAMIHAVFGGLGQIDLHTGGSDLKFPHHDNEIAQAEAYYLTKNWVPYFMHVGSLTIKGLKMSKSLKNFLTIRDTLETRSARVIRLMFLLHRYNSELRFDPNYFLR
jgi:cysteinyl-tRNA synthetase